MQTFTSDIPIRLSRRDAIETCINIHRIISKRLKKEKWSGLSLVVHQGSSVSSHWTLKPLDWGSNHIDLQRYTVFLILDQPEKTLGSVRLKCNFFPFFNLPLVLRSYKSICWQRSSLHSIAGTLNLIIWRETSWLCKFFVSFWWFSLSVLCEQMKDSCRKLKIKKKYFWKLSLFIATEHDK